MPLELEEFRAHSTPGRMRCTVANLLDALEEADAQVLADAVADPTITSTAIAKVLTANGHTVSAHPIQRHRRGDCTCDA